MFVTKPQFDPSILKRGNGLRIDPGNSAPYGANSYNAIIVKVEATKLVVLHVDEQGQKKFEVVTIDDIETGIWKLSHLRPIVIGDVDMSLSNYIADHLAFCLDINIPDHIIRDKVQAIVESYHKESVSEAF